MDLTEEYAKGITPEDEIGNFFVTAFETLPASGGLGIGDSRCFGYLPTFKAADRAVRNNTCDINEGLYEYAVIERIDYGIHPTALQRWFYKYSVSRDAYDSIPEPEVLKHLTNFSIG